jgi:hypothetical protein
VRIRYRLDGWRLPFSFEVDRQKAADREKAIDRELATTEIAVIETEVQKS